MGILFIIFQHVHLLNPLTLYLQTNLGCYYHLPSTIFLYFTETSYLYCSCFKIFNPLNQSPDIVHLHNSIANHNIFPGRDLTLLR